jgi:hypothetical protein
LVVDVTLLEVILMKSYNIYYFFIYIIYYFFSPRGIKCSGPPIKITGDRSEGIYDKRWPISSHSLPSLSTRERYRFIFSPFSPEDLFLFFKVKPAPGGTGKEIYHRLWVIRVVSRYHRPLPPPPSTKFLPVKKSFLRPSLYIYILIIIASGGPPFPSLD